MEYVLLKLKWHYQNGLLPGKPLEPSSTNVSLKECDDENVSSMSTPTLELTDGTMVTRKEDSDSEFFDALDNSI